MVLKTAVLKNLQYLQKNALKEFALCSYITSFITLQVTLRRISISFEQSTQPNMISQKLKKYST